MFSLRLLINMERRIIHQRHRVCHGLPQRATPDPNRAPLMEIIPHGNTVSRSLGVDTLKPVSYKKKSDFFTDKINNH
jgi:hypothetical protein